MDQVSRICGPVVIESAERIEMNRGAILVIEDCEPLLFYLNTALLTLGYSQQFLASNLAEAHSVWTQHKDEIGHILLNYELPDGVSFDFAALTMKQRPSVNDIVTSGYDISIVRESAGNAKRFHFLQKPFRLAELKEMIDAGCPNQKHQL